MNRTQQDIAKITLGLEEGQKKLRDCLALLLELLVTDPAGAAQAAAAILDRKDVHQTADTLFQEAEHIKAEQSQEGR